MLRVFLRKLVGCGHVVVFMTLFLVAVNTRGEKFRTNSETSVADRQIAVEHNLRYLTTFKGHLMEPGMSIRSQMRYHHVPGVSIAVIRHGRVEWAKGYGVASLRGRPVTVDTLFNAASMSKPLTAMAVLKLVQEKKLSLDSDVNSYLKLWKIPNNKYTVRHKVTVRELLNHTSGIGTHNSEVLSRGEKIPSILEMLNGTPPAAIVPVRVETEPGSRFAYSNGAYLVLQLLISEVTGESFGRYLQDTVLTPLQMSHSTFTTLLSASLAANAATGYEEDGTTSIDPAHFVKPNAAAGGLWTTAVDYAKFIIELQKEYSGQSSLILNKDTARLMLNRGMGPSNDQYWGLGIGIGGSTNRPYFEHGGSGIFQTESVGYFDGDGVVILTNGGGGAYLANEVLRSVAAVYHWPDFQTVEHSLADIDSSQFSKLVGTYDFIRISMENHKLMAEIPVGTRKQVLYPESAVRYFLRDTATTITFDLDSTGRPTGLDFVTPIGHSHRNKM
jgi:CubicO group peptidase (beta-lactamase class C family)